MSDGFTHRRRRRPLRATASWSGAVSLRRLAQGRLDTLNWRYDYDAMSGLRPASSGGDRGRGVTPGEECLASHTLLYPDTAGGRWWGGACGGVTWSEGAVERGQHAQHEGGGDSDGVPGLL